MYHALDMGISVADFWELSARAIVVMQREMIKAHKAASRVKTEKQRGQRLNYIPRP